MSEVDENIPPKPKKLKGMYNTGTGNLTGILTILKAQSGSISGAPI